MSTAIDYVVDTEATLTNAPELAERVVNDLIRRGIVLATPQRHEHLEGGPRYATGPNANRVATINECFPCGLDVQLGRVVYDAGENGLKSICYPTCDEPTDLTLEDWPRAIGDWAHGGQGQLMCFHCHSANPISVWTFDPTFGFGELAFQFSEWMLEKDFVDELSRLLGHRVAWVQSHI